MRVNIESLSSKIEDVKLIAKNIIKSPLPQTSKQIGAIMNKYGIRHRSILHASTKSSDPNAKGSFMSETLNS